MEKWIMVVRTNCTDPSREDEFNDWYDNIHVPDVMEVPEIVRTSRFLNPDSSSWESGKYLAIYEIETEDIGRTSAAMERNRAVLRERGRGSDLGEGVSVIMYKQIGSFPR